MLQSRGSGFFCIKHRRGTSVKLHVFFHVALNGKSKVVSLNDHVEQPMLKRLPILADMSLAYVSLREYLAGLGEPQESQLYALTVEVRCGTEQFIEVRVETATPITAIAKRPRKRQRDDSEEEDAVADHDVGVDPEDEASEGDHVSDLASLLSDVESLASTAETGIESAIEEEQVRELPEDHDEQEFANERVVGAHDAAEVLPAKVCNMIRIGLSCFSVV